jgi:alkylmercury lyase
MSHEPIDLEELSAAVSGRMPHVSDEEGAVALSLYRLLSEGSPVSVARLAEVAGRSQAEVMAVLGGWPGIFYEDGAVIGFWGLALGSTSHELTIRGKRLSTWCAWDALFIPDLIGQSALVSSLDPVTGEEISLTVVPCGIDEVSSPGIVVSFMDPSAIDFDDNVILNFCNYVHFFASVDSGTEWVAEHPATFLLSLDEAFHLGQRTNRTRYGGGLAGAAGGGGDGQARPRVVVQYFEGCAGWQTATARLREALRLVGLEDHEIRFQNVETPEQAAQLGFAGSPTILLNGVDLFADANPSAGYACRIYRTELGPEGAPSLSQLTARLAGASHG